MIHVGTMAGCFSRNSTNLDNAKVLAGLEAAHGPEKARRLFDQMYWLEDLLAPTTVAGGEHARIKAEAPLPEAGRFEHLLGQDVPVGDTDRPRASDIWNAGPKKTADGSTMVLNGRRFGNFNPSYVYSVGLHGGGFDLTGSTPFAVPGILFGTNGRIAWGATGRPAGRERPCPA